MKRRIMALTELVVPAVLAAGLFGASAQAQTVADYEAALHAVPVGAVASPTGSEACMALVNYTFVSIAEGDRVDAFPLIGSVLALVDDDSAVASQGRSRCEQAMKQTVIKFDGGLGEDIVPQPDLEDVEAPFRGAVRTDAGDAYRPVASHRSISH